MKPANVHIKVLYYTLSLCLVTLLLLFPLSLFGFDKSLNIDRYHSAITRVEWILAFSVIVLSIALKYIIKNDTYQSSSINQLNRVSIIICSIIIVSMGVWFISPARQFKNTESIMTDQIKSINLPYPIQSKLYEHGECLDNCPYLGVTYAPIDKPLEAVAKEIIEYFSHTDYGSNASNEVVYDALAKNFEEGGVTFQHKSGHYQAHVGLTMDTSKKVVKEIGISISYNQ